MSSERCQRTGLPLAWLQELPVFPLPRVVFFPGTKLPLHLFEPRYRAMISDCVRHDRPAMAITLLKPGYEEDYEGRPPVHEICGLGRIESHEELPDGRFNVLLTGVGRVRLHELPESDLPYRRARAEVLDDRQATDQVGGDSMTALLSMASMVATAVRKRHPDFALGASADDPPGQVADNLADRLLSDPDARQQVLQTLSVPHRIQCLTEHVASVLSQLELANNPGGGVLH